MKSSLPEGLLAAAVLACVLPAAHAAGFAAQVSPPRFELRASPGELLREVIEIGNGATEPVNYRFQTADWDLDAQGGLVLRPPRLRSGSCRPWTRLERPQLQLGAGVIRRYRFEVHVPAGAKPQECRFAILIDAPDQAHSAQAGQIQLPVAGRIAVIVYVAVGGVSPALSLEKLRVTGRGTGQRISAVFHNAGSAHGRPQGLLQGIAADGRRYDLLLSNLPVLPGERRDLRLVPKLPDGSDADAPPRLPLEVTGTLEWEGGQTQVNAVLR